MNKLERITLKGCLISILCGVSAGMLNGCANNGEQRGRFYPTFVGYFPLETPTPEATPFYTADN